MYTQTTLSWSLAGASQLLGLPRLPEEYLRSTAHLRASGFTTCALARTTYSLTFLRRPGEPAGRGRSRAREK